MTTYIEMLAASQDSSLTMSQKLDILFKDAEYETYEKSLRYIPPTDMAMVPSILKEKEAVLLAHDADCQLLIFRLNDGTYHQLDTGSYTIDESMIYLLAMNDMDQEDQDFFWSNLLEDDMEDQCPLFFYRGGFVDHDLEKNFTRSFY